MYEALQELIKKRVKGSRNPNSSLLHSVCHLTSFEFHYISRGSIKQLQDRNPGMIYTLKKYRFVEQWEVIEQEMVGTRKTRRTED